MLLQSIISIWIFSLCFADIDGKFVLFFVSNFPNVHCLSIETFLFCQTSPPKLNNGLIKRDRVSYYKGQGYLGTMEYTCLPGFNLDGNKIITCQNGIWSTMPQCICIYFDWISFFPKTFYFSEKTMFTDKNLSSEYNN